MGNRAVIIVTNGRYWSPTIYLHWNGSEVPEILSNAVNRIRMGDVSCSCARIIGTAHEMIKGSFYLGVNSNDWSERATELREHNIRARWEPSCEDLDDVDPGDNGIFIFDCNTGSLTQYLFMGGERGYNGYKVINLEPIDMSAATRYV